ncbi:MAG: hypothetical protein IPM29_09235 [Planctomycetes bacterium]|nr:hypothetical protein [Planctomycetota bacterium]
MSNPLRPTTTVHSYGRPRRAGARTVAFAVATALLVGAVPAQGDARDSGLSREQMWRAPTAEDWKRPVLIEFQRTWEDAVEVSRATGKPILICVNMDGEPASEHYAGIRYRQPDVARLYEPYVCVIASVYRHTPRDHDEQGNRILCPRFGSVTCGEHIAIEPALFDKYFDGVRVAPRHIMVELDGSESYDVYYAFDTKSVFDQIRDGIESRGVAPPSVVRGDRAIVDRVASRDAEDRRTVEQAYREGNRELREQLVDAAAEHIDAAPIDLLRLAVFGFDSELAAKARTALAQSQSAEAVDLINDALRVPMAQEQRDALIAALQRLGATSARARTLAVVHQGLQERSSDVDVDGWSRALSGGASYAAPGWSDLEAKLQAQASEAATRPDAAGPQVELAVSTLELAVDPKTTEILNADRRTANAYARLMFEDAMRAALEAQRLGSDDWRTDAVLALCDYYLGDVREAYRRAEDVVKRIPSGAEGYTAMATLALFAEARQRAIWRAMRNKEQWPGQWLTDVNDAYSVIARHPLGTDRHALVHYDFLKALGADGRAWRVLVQGLQRYPDSWQLHDRLRAHVLEQRGVEGLEAIYAQLMQEAGKPSANLEWFAGYAAIVAAEFHRKQGSPDLAVGAYQRALGHYDRAIELDGSVRPTADHYAAIVLAGLARLAQERGDLDAAVSLLVAGLERKPEATDVLDGLNISPADTIRTLRGRLAEAGRTELSARLEAAVAKLDPALLRLPDYERGLPDANAPQGGPGRRRGGGR